jgi:glycine cleavage system protein P-like pyridoxal-binding family
MEMAECWPFLAGKDLHMNTRVTSTASSTMKSTEMKNERKLKPSHQSTNLHPPQPASQHLKEVP